MIARTLSFTAPPQPEIVEAPPPLDNAGLIVPKLPELLRDSMAFGTRMFYEAQVRALMQHYDAATFGDERRLPARIRRVRVTQQQWVQIVRSCGQDAAKLDEAEAQYEVVHVQGEPDAGCLCLVGGNRVNAPCPVHAPLDARKRSPYYGRCWRDPSTRDLYIGEERFTMNAFYDEPRRMRRLIDEACLRWGVDAQQAFRS